MSSKDTLIHREAQRAKQEVQDMSSFIKSKYNLYVLAQVMLVGGMIISAATEGWHLENKFNSIALAVVGVLLIESISVIMGNMVVNDVRSGIMSAGNIAKSMFAFSLVLYFGATYFSVTLTLDGAPDFYEFQRAQTAPPSQMDKDSVNAYFQTEIAAIDADIAEQKGTRWKGTITTQANRNINQLIKMKQIKDQERKDALSYVEVFNQDEVKAWEADLADDQKIVMGFAGLGEIIKIFAIIFIALFKEGRNQELGIHAIERKLGVDIDGDGAIGTPKGKRPPGYYPTPAAADGGGIMEAPTPTPRRPIGFFRSSTPETVDDNTSHYSASQCPPVPTAPKSLFDEMEEEVLLFALKYAVGSKQKWSNKNDIGAGTAETNNKHISKWSRYAEAIQERLQNLSA